MCGYWLDYQYPLMLKNSYLCPFNEAEVNLPRYPRREQPQYEHSKQVSTTPPTAWAFVDTYLSMIECMMCIRMYVRISLVNDFYEDQVMIEKNICVHIN